MKNINLCRLTLVFSSFLLTHYSYSSVSTDLSYSKCALTAKTEKTYCKSNDNEMPTAIKNEYVTERYSNEPALGAFYGSISISDGTTQPTDPIDPDWRKLVAHFY